MKIKQMDKSKVGLIALFCSFGPLSILIIGSIIYFAVSDYESAMTAVIIFSVIEIFILVFGFFIICLVRKNLAQAEQKVQAMVFEKEKYKYWQPSPGSKTGGHMVLIHYATFELSDGERIKLDLYATAYEMLRENSKGILCYRERKGEKWFIGFDPAD